MLSDQEAVDHIVDGWQTLHHGMVNTTIIEPWLLVRRGGGDYAAFISLVSGDIFVLTDGGSLEDLPMEPTAELSDERREMIKRAFEAQSTGTYPLPDDGVFAISFKEDGHKQLRVGFQDNTMEIIDV